MKQWEYETLNPPSNVPIKIILNNWGLTGWELVSLEWLKDGSAFLIFKREKKVIVK